jgi:hypothetical protein
MARTSQRYQIEIPKREEGNLFLTPPHRESSNSPKRALVAGAARSFAFLFRASKKRRWMGLVMEIDMKLDGVFFHPSMGVLHFRLLAYGGEAPSAAAAAVAACVCCLLCLCLVCLDYVYECSNCLFVEV